jgi:hypothetical protein
MVPLDLPVHFRTTWMHMPVRDAEVGKVPVNRGPNEEPLSVNFLNREVEMLPDLPEKVDRGLGIVVVLDAQHAELRRFINGRDIDKTADALFPPVERTSHPVGQSGWNIQRCIRLVWDGMISLV